MTMTLEQAAKYGWEHSRWSLVNVLIGIREHGKDDAHLAQQAALIGRLRELATRWNSYAMGTLDRAIAMNDCGKALTALLDAHPAGEPPCSLSEALNVIEHWGRRGNTLQEDDVARLRALTDKIAPVGEPDTFLLDIAWGSFTTDGYWLSNPNLVMSSEEQKRQNELSGGYVCKVKEMDMNGPVSAAVVGEDGERTVRFEVWQDEECSAGSDTLADALHYCAMYQQDGPVELRKVVSYSTVLDAMSAGGE